METLTETQIKLGDFPDWIGRIVGIEVAAAAVVHVSEGVLAPLGHVGVVVGRRHLQLHLNQALQK